MKRWMMIQRDGDGEIMQTQKKKRIYIVLLVLGVIGAVTILFFSGEKWLADGEYYIPGSAMTVALILCIFWQGALITGVCFLSAQLKKRFRGWVKTILMVPTVTATNFLVLFLAWNWILYSFKFEEKVEQYDDHIALYVDNTFVRTRFRYPHYMYEENWLIMRRLSNDELNEAILKYGDPDKYYN